MRAPRWLPVAGVTLLASAFTWLNRSERVPVDLGILRFYRAPLTVVAFLAFLAGMLSMLLLSLRHDRRLREELRARGLLEPARPEPASAPAASAWGVAREPDPTREEADERTVAYPRYEEKPAAREDDDRTVAFPRYDEDPAA